MLKECWKQSSKGIGKVKVKVMQSWTRIERVMQMRMETGKVKVS